MGHCFINIHFNIQCIKPNIQVVIPNQYLVTQLKVRISEKLVKPKHDLNPASAPPTLDGVPLHAYRVSMR